MSKEQLELLIEYIDLKIEYEFQSHEVGADGYRCSPSNNLQRELEAVLNKLLK